MTNNDGTPRGPPPPLDDKLIVLFDIDNTLCAFSIYPNGEARADEWRNVLLVADSKEAGIAELMKDKIRGMCRVENEAGMMGG